MKKQLMPNDLGIFEIVEGTKRINVNTFVKLAKKQFIENLQQYSLKADDIQVTLITSKTNFGGKRYWIKCPLCKQRVGFIYKHQITSQIGCRKCLGLKYKKQRFKGMIENL